MLKIWQSRTPDLTKLKKSPRFQKMGEPSKWSTTFRPHFLPPAKSFDADWPLIWTRIENTFNIIYTSVCINIFLSLLDSIIDNWSKPIARIYWNAKTMSPPLILSPFHSLNSCLLSSLDHRFPFEGAHRKAMVTFFLLYFFLFPFVSALMCCFMLETSLRQPPATSKQQKLSTTCFFRT